MKRNKIISVRVNEELFYKVKSIVNEKRLKYDYAEHKIKTWIELFSCFPSLVNASDIFEVALLELVKKYENK